MIHVTVNGVPLDHYEDGENFKEETRCHYLYRHVRPKHRSRKERNGPVRHLTREEIRAEYGTERCPYTWEEICTWLMENLTVHFNVMMGG